MPSSEPFKTPDMRLAGEPRSLAHGTVGLPMSRERDASVACRSGGRLVSPSMSPEALQWAQGTQIADANGNPLVCYHATSQAGLSHLLPGSDGGIYLSTDPIRVSGIGPHIYSVLVRSQRVLDVRHEDSFTSRLVTEFDNDLNQVRKAGYDAVWDATDIVVLDPEHILVLKQG